MLLTCTFLYAMIVEILVNVVDVHLSVSGIDDGWVPRLTLFDMLLYLQNAVKSVVLAAPAILATTDHISVVINGLSLLTTH